MSPKVGSEPRLSLGLASIQERAPRNLRQQAPELFMLGISEARSPETSTNTAPAELTRKDRSREMRPMGSSWRLRASNGCPPMAIVPQMTIRERLQAVDKQRVALSQLIATFEADREAALAALPQKFGYPSLDEFLTAVTAACSPKKRPYRRRQVTAPKTPKAKTATEVTAPKQPSVGTTDDKAQEVPALPAGTDLNDPQNFGALPDESLLDAAASPDSGYYDRLAVALAYARKVLATSGVPAAVWRAWRFYEQKAGDILRNRHAQNAGPADAGVT